MGGDEGAEKRMHSCRFCFFFGGGVVSYGSGITERVGGGGEA